MKTLTELSNIEKARLLGQLFRRELPMIVESIEATCKQFLKEEAYVRAHWDNGFLQVDLWYTVVRELEVQIGKYRFDMGKSPNVFADQLFYGYRAMVSVQSLLKMDDINNGASSLKQAINLFFG